MEISVKVKTRDFGEVEVNTEDIISFEQKIFGFDRYTDFIMLYDDEFNGEYAWLQSVEEPELCFIIANPELLIKDYDPCYPPEVKSVLGSGTYEKWLIMVVKESIEDSTVNLKSPIIINFEKHRAMQVILEDEYPVRYRLFDNGQKE